MNFAPILEDRTIHTSVPCRVDFGGTLDISTFFMPLSHLGPATLNLALDMRTHVRLLPWKPGRIKISSRGFDSIERDRQESGIDNPMGLMFAVAQFFNAHGVHISIDSSSPPRSALGGSSSAATAIFAAFYAALDKPIDPVPIAWLAHFMESLAAGVPCWFQDQTAAAFGGVNLWEWGFKDTGPGFKKRPVYEDKKDLEALNRHVLVAYCGIPHESKDVNGKWVRAFKRGEVTREFQDIIQITREFTTALQNKNFSLAGQLMNTETRIRCKMTPEVLDNTGKKLFEKAEEMNCGARFTGAGGGGCLWAIGELDQIKALEQVWQSILDTVPGGVLLNTAIDTWGIQIHHS